LFRESDGLLATLKEAYGGTAETPETPEPHAQYSRYSLGILSTCRFRVSFSSTQFKQENMSLSDHPIIIGRSDISVHFSLLTYIALVVAAALTVLWWIKDA